jgi:hypothetical protein
MARPAGAPASPVLKHRIRQVRKRWWLVLLCAGVAVLSALPTLHEPRQYMATSTLVLSSSHHLDDTTMAIGYSTLFNDPATIGRLRAANNIPPDVEFACKTVASSPIIAISSTASDPEIAQDSAQVMAEAFRDDVNAVQRSAYDKAIQANQDQLNALVSRPVPPDGTPDPLIPILAQRLDTLRSELTGQLQELQVRAGVVEIPSKRVFGIAARAVGGLLLGIVAALGMAAVSTRLDGSADVLDKTGVEPLVEIPAGGSQARNRLREDRLRALANIVAMQDLPKSTVVAFTDCRGAREAAEMADAVATLSAQKGHQTVLVRADNDARQRTDGAGFNDVITFSDLAQDVLKDGAVAHLKVMTPGSFVDDRYSLITRDRMVALIDELRLNADIIVVAAPPITAMEAQQICAAADFTIIVAGRRSSRAGDVTSAIDTLADARAILLGTVLADKTSRRGRHDNARGGTP